MLKGSAGGSSALVAYLETEVASATNAAAQAETDARTAISGLAGVTGMTETSGPTQLEIGSVSDGQF